MAERSPGIHTRPRRFSISLRWKIVGLVTFVALSVLGFSAYTSYIASIPESRGRFLRKHYERFDEYRLGLGRALAANASFVAQAPQLVAQLSGGRVEEAELVLQIVQRGQNNASESVANAVARSTDATVGTAAFDRVVTAVRSTLDPDLVFAFDRRGAVIGTDEIDAAEASRSRLIADLSSGITVVGELAVIGENVYQVSGAPVRDGEGNVVGGLVLGQRIERYLRDFKEQSDSDESKQYRITLVGRNGRVLASVFPTEKFRPLAEALDPANHGEEQEGRDETVPVIDLEGAIYDFWSEPVEGYSGQHYGPVGEMFLLRTRDFKQSEADKRRNTIAVQFVVVGGLAIGVALLFAWFITRRIKRYVRATEDLARGQGDLTRRLDAAGNDELGHLADNLNAVFGYIHDLAAGVQSSAFQVGASSAEISAASKQMLEGAQEQARKTESSSAAVTELSASIQQVAENAMEATRVARSSGEAVKDAIDRMNEIRVTVEEAAARIQELGESGKRIGNIVEVIRQISDQTTLLALNAAIEAAHAGEQGRGFAVVADEVSQLAKRVGQSARDIEDLIATIKEQTAAAVKAMETGTHEVEAGTSLVTRTLSDLQTLVGVVEDTAKAVQEQAVASDEIARNMDVVQRIAQDVLGASEEAVAQGEHLHRLAHALEQSVKGFKISSALPAEPARPALPAESTRE